MRKTADESRSRGVITVRSLVRAIGADSAGGRLLFAVILFGAISPVAGVLSLVGGGQETSWWRALSWAFTWVAVGVSCLYVAWRILLRRVARATAIESLPDEPAPAGAVNDES